MKVKHAGKALMWVLLAVAVIGLGAVALFAVNVSRNPEEMARYRAIVASWTKTPPPAAPMAFPPTAVTAVKVTTRDVPIYIDQIGKCASPEIVGIKAQASGQIVKIHFTEGADVKAGQPLFTIDPAPYHAALEQAQAEEEINAAALTQSDAVLQQYRAQLDEAKADLAQNQSRQVMYNSELKRAKSLEGVIAQQDYDAKKMAADAGESQIRSNQAVIARVDAQIKQSAASIEMAKAKIKSSKAAALQASINLKYTEIASPIDGRTGQRLVDLGNVVTAIGNTSQSLLTIQSMNPIYTEFSIPERELSRVRASMTAGTLKVECRLPEKLGEPHAGEVFFIDNAIQDGTGTIKLRARIKNDDRFFWPGQFVKVRLILENKKDATLVPAEATQLGQVGPFVFVVKADSTVELRPVKLGLRYDDFIAIDEGVKSGETVVLKGQLMLQPGAPVSVQSDVKKETPKDADSKTSEPKKEVATEDKSTKVEVKK